MLSSLRCQILVPVDRMGCTILSSPYQIQLFFFHIKNPLRNEDLQHRISHVPQGLEQYWKPIITLVSAYKIDCVFLTVNWISTEKILMFTLIRMACHAGGTQWLSPTKYTFCWEGTTWFTSGVIPCNWDLFCTPYKNLNTGTYIYIDNFTTLLTTDTIFAE